MILRRLKLNLGLAALLLYRLVPPTQAMEVGGIAEAAQWIREERAERLRVLALYNEGDPENELKVEAKTIRAEPCAEF